MADSARQLIATWVEAQNNGDFAGYSALYADAFRGIKRVGHRMSRYDRARWLADRRAMFAKPTVVDARDVEVRPLGDRVSVTFTQSWTSAKYADVGTKAMLLLISDEGLRIVAEAMLDSTVARRGDTPIAPDDFRFVIESQHFHMMLEITDEEGWLTGPPLLEAPRRRLAIARKRVRPGSIPERYSGLRGQTVALYGLDGRVCTAALGDLYGLRRGVPRYDVQECWERPQLCDDNAPPGRMTDAQVTSQMWDEGRLSWMDEDAQHYMLVAELVPQEGNCAGARWARSIERPPLITFHAEPAGPEMVQEVWEALEKVRRYQETVRDHASASGSEGSSVWRDEVDHFVIREWSAIDRTLVTFEARCPEGRARWLTVVFELHGHIPHPLMDQEDEQIIEAIADFDGNGIPDLVATDGNAPDDTANVLIPNASGQDSVWCPFVNNNPNC